MKFILTIDTEADDQWSHGIPLTTKNISCIPALQELCNRHHILPTYFVTSEICEDKNAAGILNKIHQNNQCEIGTHLHVWTTPPFPDSEGLSFNDRQHAFANEIPAALFEQKLRHITDQVKDSFGHSPVSFRSGRYGYDKSMAAALTKNGYKIDSSVTPYTSWKKTAGLINGTGGPDFSRVDNHLYTLKTEYGELLEVPVTILFTKNALKKHPKWAEFIARHRNKYFNKFLALLKLNNQPLWLRPSPDSSVSDLKEVVHTAESIGLEYLVMMFHSSELLPGGSPYWKSEHDVEGLFETLSEFFIFLKSKNIVSQKLCDILHRQNGL